MRPGKVAQTGLDAGRPLLDSISDLMGYWSFFENFIQIACMLFAWALVLLAFFILAIQLFVTLIEFKLTTLAGFVLIPFGLFGKSAFMAERVLGNVISSGIKVLVLAVIIGIGSTLFSEFTAGFGGATPSIDDAMAIVLAALSLLGLGIFGPGIANGLVSGGPQLGAGAAIGTGLAAGGMVAAGAAPLAPSLRRRRPCRRRAAAARGGRRSQAARPPPTASARPAIRRVRRRLRSRQCRQHRREGRRLAAEARRPRADSLKQSYRRRQAATEIAGGAAGDGEAKPRRSRRGSRHRRSAGLGEAHEALSR
jgi:type IV secretion system protein TrbL